ncbi:MAG: hypothetical protein R3E39_19550 [Anaerolineae bacterium]
MTSLPVREMVLYKHGVGFFVREGALEGENVALTFRHDEINDVLKSLAVFDKAGGQVLGIHYQTPMDIEARLASSSIRLSDSASLRDLLVGLRGRQVKLEVGGDNPTFFSGRMLGVDDFTEEQEYIRSRERRVSLLVDGRGVVTFDWLTVRAVQILDAQAEHDLTYFLDTSMSEDARRTVNVRLSSGAHDLAVYYVAPSPTWRVSYRLVAEADEGGQSGKALLQGWGLFDNRLEEDLDNVQVTLVAGQPISFIYDLYASRIPARPTVQDEARVAPGPVEYAGLHDMPFEDVEDEERVRGIAIGARRAAPQFSSPLNPMEHVRTRPGMYVGGSAPPAAQAKEAGEFFQYIVTAPVSVKRGESALVPIIGSEIKYERELLYNGAKLPTHPVVAMRFSNTTGLTLERGPVTVVEDGDYKGEAIIPFTKDGSEVYVPFAVELGVRVTEEYNREAVTTGLRIEKAMFAYEQYDTLSTTYVMDNATAKPLTITIEAPINSNWELVDTPLPDAETATERRWRVNLPARSKTRFIAKQRIRTLQHQEVRKLEYKQLQTIIQNGWLSDLITGELSTMLEQASNIQSAAAQQVSLDAERAKIYTQQEQLRANLAALQNNRDEGSLRKRMLSQLEASQNRLEAIEREVNDLTRQIVEAEQKIKDIIAGLG